MFTSTENEPGGWRGALMAMLVIPTAGIIIVGGLVVLLIMGITSCTQWTYSTDPVSIETEVSGGGGFVVHNAERNIRVEARQYMVEGKQIVILVVQARFGNNWGVTERPAMNRFMKNVLELVLREPGYQVLSVEESAPGGYLQRVEVIRRRLD